jgi:predicted transcriptional regulator
MTEDPSGQKRPGDPIGATLAETNQENLDDLAKRAYPALLEEDAAFRAAIEVGLADIRAGRVVDFDSYRQELERRMAARIAASKA